jgi:lycopene beta-cyclase
MTQVWDIVIAGGGLSGLAMAIELAQPRFGHLKILLVEARASYQRDRTWSFWAQGEHAHTHLERARWSHWRVALQGQQALCSGAHTYRSIDADAFYADALTKIRRAPHIHMRMGVTVAQLVPDARTGPCRVVLGDGSCHATGLVLDARPAVAKQTHGPALAQHFVGWEIDTDVDVFTPDRLDLMDFMPAPDGLHFFYVLPYSQRRALVEATWVSAPHLHHDYAAQLERYLASRFGDVAHRRVYTEQGSLSLDAVVGPQARGPVVRIGRAAGTLRPSTGFAFRETVADCARLARQIEQCHFPLQDDAARAPLHGFRRRALDRFMDAWFMRVLAADWLAAPQIFMALFMHTPADRLVRFLSGQATWLDRAAVAASLPKWRFLIGLWRSLWPSADAPSAASATSATSATSASPAASVASAASAALTPTRAHVAAPD